MGVLTARQQEGARGWPSAQGCAHSRLPVDPQHIVRPILRSGMDGQAESNAGEM